MPSITTLYIKPEGIEFYTSTHGAMLVVEVEYELGRNNRLLDYYINTVGITKNLDSNAVDIMELIEENSRLWGALEAKVVAMVEDELRDVQEREYERRMEQEREGER